MSEPRPTRYLSFTGGAGWSAALVILLAFTVSLTASLREGAGDDVVNVTACYALVHFALIFALVRFYRPDDRLRDALGVRPTNPLHVIFAAGVGAGLYPAIARLNARFVAAFPLDEEAQASLDRLYHAPTVSSKIVLFVAVALLVPICEELFFRGVLFGALVRGRGDVQKRGPLVMVACAGYFALAQGDFRILLTSVVLGLALSWLRWRSGSTFLAIVAHVSHLAVPLGPLLHGGEMREDDSFDLRWVAGGLVLTAVSAAVLFVLLRSGKAAMAARQRDVADAADGAIDLGGD